MPHRADLQGTPGGVTPFPTGFLTAHEFRNDAATRHDTVSQIYPDNEKCGDLALTFGAALAIMHFAVPRAEVAESADALA